MDTLRFDGDDRFRCVRCNDMLNIAMGAAARVTTHNDLSLDGLHVLELDGEEIHRCRLRSHQTSSRHHA